MRLIAIALVVVSTRAFADVEVGNDSWVDGGNATTAAGFIAGEMAAARLSPPGAGSWRLTQVRIAYGSGSGGSSSVTLNVYDDSAGTTAPGTPLFNQSYSVTPSDTDLVVLPISSSNVQVSGPFRVAVEAEHAAAPAIRMDNDGLTSGRNFVNVNGVGWVTAESLAIPNDYVIRADLSQPGPDAGSDGGLVPGFGATCHVTSECQPGLYCFDAGTCTYDCRGDIDCSASKVCQTSTGQCVAGGPCGCSSSVGGLGVIAAAVLALGLRRRRYGA